MVSGNRIGRFSVHLVRLDPTVGAEMKKIRPCVVISPDAIHREVDTVIIAPLTSQLHGFRFRIRCQFDGREGEIALDQMRSVDRRRLIKHIGVIDAPTTVKLRAALMELFR